MFVDKVVITIRAGKGGNGKLSFRHEKFIERGGPDGGDGGNGGNVIALASNNQNTLANFRYKKLVAAEPGGDGDKRKKHGKKGVDLIVKLPVGTVVSNEIGEIIADLSEDGQTELLAEGGKGGFGNAHFISSTRQAPRIVEKGEPGEEFEAVLELKMIADVGLVGLPNAGKSTLLAKISNATPEIANYPFTTLKPNLGVVDVDSKNTLLFADIPGLIEGASEGKGLGDDFLRHIERTNVLVHLIDAYSDNLESDYKTILEELKKYKVDLSKKPQVVVINKIDGLDDEILADLINRLKKVVKKSTKIFAISAKSGEGCRELLYELANIQSKLRTKPADKSKELPVITLKQDETNDWTVKKIKNGFLISGTKLEKFAHRTNFDSFDGINRLKDIMQKTGIMRELKKQELDEGDKIVIGDPEIGSFIY